MQNLRTLEKKVRKLFAKSWLNARRIIACSFFKVIFRGLVWNGYSKSCSLENHSKYHLIFTLGRRYIWSFYWILVFEGTRIPSSNSDHICIWKQNSILRLLSWCCLHNGVFRNVCITTGFVPLTEHFSIRVSMVTENSTIFYRNVPTTWLVS
jgi:hypothetical protein